MNIPGTVGGAVKMNANAYGGDLSRVLEWVEVADASGHRAPRRPSSSASPTGARTWARARSWPAPRSRSRAAEPERVKATLADMRDKRKAAQPSGIKTFGSTFKNPDDPRAEGRSAGVLLDEAGCRGLQVGGARFPEKHANFVENTGDATTADVIALMAEGRRRVRERFGVELEPEVQFLGEVDASELWSHERAGRRGLRRPLGAVLALSPRMRRRLLAAIAATAVLAALYFFWLRDSSLVGVERVAVTGLETARRRAACGSARPLPPAR